MVLERLNALQDQEADFRSSHNLGLSQVRKQVLLEGT